jgi:hypothetical protein
VTETITSLNTRDVRFPTSHHRAFGLDDLYPRSHDLDSLGCTAIRAHGLAP